MASCCLCSDAPRIEPIEPWNQPLLETSNFIVLPSLGALIEGWLLIVPKKHFICVGELPDPLTTEMHQIKGFLFSVLRELYGEVCAFEHGPSRPNLSVGCGVDHAHLHILPLPFDLLTEVIPFLPEDVIWSKAGPEQCRTAFSRGEDYLYLEQPAGVGYIATDKCFKSQLFRRAIAKAVGVPEDFNWREHPGFSNIMATIKKLRAYNGGVSTWTSQPQIAA